MYLYQCIMPNIFFLCLHDSYFSHILIFWIFWIEYANHCNYLPLFYVFNVLIKIYLASLNDLCLIYKNIISIRIFYIIHIPKWKIIFGWNYLRDDKEKDFCYVHLILKFCMWSTFVSVSMYQESLFLWRISLESVYMI